MRPFKVIVLVLLGLACGVGAIVLYNRFTSSDVITGNPGAAVAAPGPVFADEDSVGAPARLIIPSINVNADIKYVGVNAAGQMQTPGVDAVDVAWYQYGPHPGNAGAAVIDGHLDIKGVPQGVFYNLDQLKVGDKVEVQTTSGQLVVFQVTNTAAISSDATSTANIFEPSTNVPQLNLITCTGDWVPSQNVYNQRLIVYTQRVS